MEGRGSLAPREVVTASFCPVAVGSAQPCSLLAPTYGGGLGSHCPADSVMGPPLCATHSNTATWEAWPGTVVTLSPGREPEVHRGASIVMDSGVGPGPRA